MTHAENAIVHAARAGKLRAHAKRGRERSPLLEEMAEMESAKARAALINIVLERRS